ncbi:hypothetical protein H5410_004952 [Solanum commersonii]|uniref:Uncharacterized protein n=1 Tax=Solanum commersonii TaxID=4109 RepID=A0A9J6A539_SOLCO|nr:hypothetical protein H5410_004952 [Solanum commersonii]
MEQTIETFKKSIDDKNLQIVQLMRKLDLSNSEESQVLRPVASPNIEEGIIVLQFGSLEPVEVSAQKKTTNTSKVDGFSNEQNGDT